MIATNELPAGGDGALLVGIIGNPVGFFVARVLTFEPGVIAVVAAPASFLVHGERSEEEQTNHVVLNQLC
jgi:hypothetical protein